MPPSPPPIILQQPVCRIHDASAVLFAACDSAYASNPPPMAADVSISNHVHTTPEETRFVSNKNERAGIINQIVLYSAPIQKLKTLETTCAKVASDASTSHVTDAQIGKEQTFYGMSWRREYMSHTKKHNVVYINSTVLKLAKSVPVTGLNPDDPEGPPRVGVQEGGTENDAQHLLDQSILDYKHAADSRTQTTEEDAAKTLQRQKESRKEKRLRLERQKEAYETRKKKKASERNARQKERRATDIQKLKAQTMFANAAAANVAIQRHQCEQFGMFLAMYATKHNLRMPQPSTALPAPLQAGRLEMDPELLNVPADGATSHIAESVSDDIQEVNPAPKAPSN